uniref:Uncharacterized protein n=1 Tax=Rhizophora mucronata TaxID=61149 RepID=A0A2P2KYD6_RHIMU
MFKNNSDHYIRLDNIYFLAN